MAPPNSECRGVMNFLKGEPIQMRRSREKWRGEAEVSSLAPKRGNKADTIQGCSHHAQVLLPPALSSGDRGREIPPPTARRRRDHLQHQKEKEPETEVGGTDREELAQECGDSCPGEWPEAFRHAGQEKPLLEGGGEVSTATAPTPPKKEKKKQPR